MFVFNEIKSFFSPKPLPPNERWEKMSANCKRDLTIKKVALDALKCLSVGSGIISFAVPFLALSLHSGGLFLAVGAAVVAVCGVAAAILGIRKAEDLQKYFDWTDYSDKFTIMQDCNRITQSSLKVLADIPQSCTSRISNLRKYGVLSSENGKRMQDIFTRYVQLRKDCKKYSYEHPDLAKSHAEDVRLKEYNGLKKQLDDVKKEWKQFQQDVTPDLPTFA